MFFYYWKLYNLQSCVISNNTFVICSQAVKSFQNITKLGLLSTCASSMILSWNTASDSNHMMHNCRIIWIFSKIIKRGWLMSSVFHGTSSYGVLRITQENLKRQRQALWQHYLVRVLLQVNMDTDWLHPFVWMEMVKAKGHTCRFSSVSCEVSPKHSYLLS